MLGKIFMIKNSENDDKFIGYTKKEEPLEKKLKRYLTGSKYCNNELYNNLAKIEQDKWNIETLEECQVDNLNELKKKTQIHIQEKKPSLNSHKAFLTDEEKKQYKKEYVKKKYDEAVSNPEQKEKLLDTARYYYNKYREERLEKAKQRRLQKAQEEGRELRATRGRPRKPIQITKNSVLMKQTESTEHHNELKE